MQMYKNVCVKVEYKYFFVLLPGSVYDYLQHLEQIYALKKENLEHLRATTSMYTFSKTNTWVQIELIWLDYVQTLRCKS